MWTWVEKHWDNLKIFTSIKLNLIGLFVVYDLCLNNVFKCDRSVEDLDLWVMGLAELRLADADLLLGKTLTHIFAEQFADLKVGDYFEKEPNATLGTDATAFTPSKWIIEILRFDLKV